MVARAGNPIQYHYIGDDRIPFHDTAPHVGNGMMMPSPVLLRDLLVPTPLQNNGCDIYDPGPTRSSINMGPPISMGPVSEIYGVRMNGTVSTTATAPTHTLQQEISGHAQARNKVAAIEQRGGSPTGQNSGNGNGAPSWFHAAPVPAGKGKYRNYPLPTCPTVGKNDGMFTDKGKGSGRSVDIANNDATTGYRTSPTEVKRSKKNAASTKSGHSETSQSLDGYKYDRDLARQSLELPLPMVLGCLYLCYKCRITSL
jgi:hypothetical protein